MNQAPLVILHDDDNDAISIFLIRLQIFFCTSFRNNYLCVKILIIFSFILKRHVGSGFLVLASRS